jgi:hypothetical protein
MHEIELRKHYLSLLLLDFEYRYGHIIDEYKLASLNSDFHSDINLKSAC